MIKLSSLLLEGKHDSLARKITADSIALLKGYRNNVDSDPTEFMDSYKDYGGFAETYATNNYTIGKDEIEATILIEVVSTSGFMKGKIGSPRNKKARLKGYSVVGRADQKASKIQIEISITYPTFIDIAKKYSEIYLDILGVARHELEHTFQTVLKIPGREEDMNRDIDMSQSTRQQTKQYRLLPTELEADAKAINLQKKKKRIPFEQAATEYYSRIPQVDKRDIKVLVNAVMDYSKKFGY